MEVIAGAEDFRLNGTKKEAVLLLHGYTGTASELFPLGKYLNGRGFTVLGVRLPGHGTCVEDLERTTADDWYRAAEAGCDSLLGEFEDVYVAGLSMGALLAIKLAALKRIKKAVFISAPIFVWDRRARFFPILRYFIRYTPKRKRDYKGLQRYCKAYDKMPTKPLGSLFRLTRECREELIGRIKAPVRILQSKIEHTVRPESASFIYDKLATPAASKRIIWFERSGHILPLDAEHEAVFEAVGKFFEGAD